MSHSPFIFRFQGILRLVHTLLLCPTVRTIRECLTQPCEVFASNYQCNGNTSSYSSGFVCGQSWTVSFWYFTFSLSFVRLNYVFP